MIGGNKLILDGEVKLSISDVSKILRIALAQVQIDETWYLGEVPDLRRDIQKGSFKSVADHYLTHGYLEGRLPERPTVDEKFYLQNNPDVAAGIKAGQVKSGYDHFVKNGYAEGRAAVPADKGR